MDPAELRILTSYLNPSDVVIDIGAHAGLWTIPLSRLVPEGTVHAFEALPYYAQTLSFVVKMLHRRNVCVHNNAVLNTEKRVDIVWRDTRGNRLTGLTHVKGETESTPDTVTVKGIRLDDSTVTATGRIRFIKLDIEGAEILALEGASALLERNRPLIFMELDDAYCKRYGRRAGDVFSFFDSRSYVGITVSEDGSRDIIPRIQDLQSNDLWFVPNEDEASFCATP